MSTVKSKLALVLVVKLKRKKKIKDNNKNIAAVPHTERANTYNPPNSATLCLEILIKY